MFTESLDLCDVNASSFGSASLVGVFDTFSLVFFGFLAVLCLVPLCIRLKLMVLFDFTFFQTNLMMASGNWNQFWALAKLDFVVLGAPSGQPAKIYANGKNMVEVVITIQMLNKEHQKMTVSEEQLRKALYFCEFDSGDELSSSWLIADQPNEYVNGVSRGDCKDGDSTHAYKYIACSKQDINEITAKIAVGINIPDVGKFDTSRDGTSTKTPSGQVFKSPKSAEITALRPIDYSIPSNLQIECGEFEMLRDNIKWNSRLTTEGPLKEHWDGKCHRRFVYIRPNKNATGQDKFKEHSIAYSPIGNSDVSTGTIWWWWDTDKNEACFSDMRQQGGFGLPGAVIGNSSDNKFRVNHWYSRKNRICLNGKFYIVDSNYYYRFNDNADDIIDNDHTGDDENGAASLVLYQLVMPVGSTSKYNWQNVIRNITVNVTDNYGNDGSVTLRFNDSDKFDEPGFV